MYPAHAPIIEYCIQEVVTNLWLVIIYSFMVHTKHSFLQRHLYIFAFKGVLTYKCDDVSITRCLNISTQINEPRIAYLSWEYICVIIETKYFRAYLHTILTTYAFFRIDSYLFGHSKFLVWVMLENSYISAPDSFFDAAPKSFANHPIVFQSG